MNKKRRLQEKRMNRGLDPETPLVKYPSPDGDRKFRRYWEMFVADVVLRENFKIGHLEQLRVLCKMYVEEEKLSDVVDLEGFTYTVSGRNGDQRKTTPEADLLVRIRTQITVYSKMLGLLLVKDSAPTDADTNKEDEDWK